MALCLYIGIVYNNYINTTNYTPLTITIDTN